MMMQDYPTQRKSRSGRGRRPSAAAANAAVYGIAVSAQPQQPTPLKTCAGGSTAGGGAGKRCSYPWINSQIIQASETGNMHQVLQVVASYLPQMNLVNLSTAVHRLAKLTANDPKGQGELRQHPALDDLLQAIAGAFAGLTPGEAQPQSLSNVAWSLATMRLVNKALVQKVSALAVTNIAVFKPFELSTMLWALAKLGTLDNVSGSTKPVFQTSAAHIMKHVQEFGFRCLATTAWAFATAKQHHARLFRGLAAQMLPMVHVANCQEMANTAWAFGTANFHDDQLFLELAEKALLRLDDFKPQELSNMLWGFASNGFFHEAFFANASMVAQRMDLQAQHLANILWAYARVQPRHGVTKSTILALLPWCTLQLDTFKPQEVSATVLAVAKAFGRNSELEVVRPAVSAAELRAQGHLPEEVLHFFSSVMPWALPRMREFSAQSLANTVSAYAMVHVPNAEALFTSIGDEVLKRYESLDSTMLLHLLKGFAAAPLECAALSGPVLQALATGVAHHVTELRPQELQALSRLCAGLQGWRRSRDLTCDELRSCLLEYAEPHSADGPYGSPHHMPMPEQVGTPELLEMNWHEDEYYYEPRHQVYQQDAHAPGKKPQKIRNVRVPTQNSGYAKQKQVWPTEEIGHSPLCTINELTSAAPLQDPYTPLCRVNEYGRTVMQPPSPNQQVAPGGPLMPLLLPHPPVPVEESQALHEFTQDLVAGYQKMAAEVIPVPRASPRSRVPFNSHELQACLADAKSASRPRLPSGAPGHTDFQWRCSIKNSFLHIEANEEGVVDSSSDTNDGGSSQRSSSVPGRWCDEEIVEDWHNADLKHLDFEWGRSRRPPAVPAGTAGSAGPITGKAAATL